MLVSQQIYLPWVVEFLSIDLLSLLRQIKSWNEDGAHVAISQSRTVIVFEQQSLDGFIQLLTTEYQNWGNKITSPVENKSGLSRENEMDGGTNARLDQFIHYLRRVFLGESRFNLAELAKFLRVDVPELLFHTRTVSKISIEDDDVVIQPILWESITEGIKEREDRRRFIDAVDMDFSYWGEKAKKK